MGNSDREDGADKMVISVDYQKLLDIWRCESRERISEPTPLPQAAAQMCSARVVKNQDRKERG